MRCVYLGGDYLDTQSWEPHRIPDETDTIVLYHKARLEIPGSRHIEKIVTRSSEYTIDAREGATITTIVQGLIEDVVEARKGAVKR